jgi:hypothetical protein
VGGVCQTVSRIEKKGEVTARVLMPSDSMDFHTVSLNRAAISQSCLDALRSLHHHSLDLPGPLQITKVNYTAMVFGQVNDTPTAPSISDKCELSVDDTAQLATTFHCHRSA